MDGEFSTQEQSIYSTYDRHVVVDDNKLVLLFFVLNCHSVASRVERNSLRANGFDRRGKDLQLRNIGLLLKLGWNGRKSDMFL